MQYEIATDIKNNKDTIDVYLLKTEHCIHGTIYKIGYSNNTFNRVYSCRTPIYIHFPKPVLILKIFKTDKFRVLEYELHRLFKDNSVDVLGSGGTEWFQINDEDIENFFNTCCVILKTACTISTNKYEPTLLKNPHYADNFSFNINRLQKQMNAAMDSWNNL